MRPPQCGQVANWNQEGLGYLRASAEIAAQLGDEAAGKVADHFVACEVGRDRFGGNPRQRIGFPGSVGKGFPGWCLGNWRVKNGGAIFEIKAPHQFKVVDGETSTGGGLQGVGKLFECLFSISSPIRTLLFELDDIERPKRKFRATRWVSMLRLAASRSCSWVFRQRSTSWSKFMRFDGHTEGRLRRIN